MSATPSLNTKSSFSACKSNLLFGGYFYDKHGKSLCCGIEISDLEKTFKKDKKHYIYFASIQDLRGSKIVGGKFDKNDDVFNIDWNCVIIDEAHEGTTTELGDKEKAFCSSQKKELNYLNFRELPSIFFLTTKMTTIAFLPGIM